MPADWEKFEKWAATVPYTLRNPLYHWTHLELQRYFDIYKLLNADTAKEIYEECNEKLRTPELQRSQPSAQNECKSCMHYR